MNVEKYPWLKDYLPININKCRNYWDSKMNGFLMSSKENKDWLECDKLLNVINDDELPITLRTYKLVVKVPFIIANFIIEGKAKQNRKIPNVPKEERFNGSVV